uniref:Uncharacterized protein n=1 Tax=Musa acuminata subsp. malaccensis TaxID=214687 RepID=A0A804KS05_MUSAM
MLWNVGVQEMMGHASADGKELLMSLSGLGAQSSLSQVVVEWSEC